MTLIEALKSGRRFKRGLHGAGFQLPCGSMKEYYRWADSDVLADDWELEPATVMITTEQLHAAILKVSPVATDYQIYAVCRELGL